VVTEEEFGRYLVRELLWELDRFQMVVPELTDVAPEEIMVLSSSGYDTLCLRTASKVLEARLSWSGGARPFLREIRDPVVGNVPLRKPRRRQMNNAELEQSLLESSSKLLEGGENDCLRNVLLREFGPLEHAFDMGSYLDQGGEFHTVLVPPDTVLVVVLPWIEGHEETIEERYSYRDYWRHQRFESIERRKLAVLEKWMR
jgi:hypothetical protein